MQKQPLAEARVDVETSGGVSFAQLNDLSFIDVCSRTHGKCVKSYIPRDIFFEIPPQSIYIRIIQKIYAPGTYGNILRLLFKSYRVLIYRNYYIYQINRSPKKQLYSRRR